MGVAISMAKVGQAWQNGYAERLMRTIKEEEMQLQDTVVLDIFWRPVI